MRELAVLNDISSLLYNDLDEQTITRTIVEKSKELIKAQFSALVLLNRGRMTRYCSSLGDYSLDETDLTGVLEEVYRDGVPKTVKAGAVSGNVIPLPGLHAESVRCALVAPVILRDKIIGELVLGNRIDGEDFSARDEDLLLTLGFHAAFAFEKARLHSEVSKLAATDGMTGLANHRAIQERLELEVERARRSKTRLSVLMLDIDFFKKLNDTYGHRVGDDVLKRVACRLVENVRAVDCAARYGGEEFLIVLPETDLRGALITAERIREECITHPLRLASREMDVTVSVGAATYPDDADTKEQLIEKADQALYAAKTQGRNRVCTFRDVKERK